MDDLPPRVVADLTRRGWKHTNDCWVKRPRYSSTEADADAEICCNDGRGGWVCAITTTVDAVAEFAAVVGEHVPGYVTIPEALAREAHQALQAQIALSRMVDDTEALEDWTRTERALAVALALEEDKPNE